MGHEDGPAAPVDDVADGGEGLADSSVVGDAVSYTHLRAHETVLDLVCRPLLEKKNPRIEPRAYNKHLPFSLRYL